MLRPVVRVHARPRDKILALLLSVLPQLSLRSLKVREEVEVRERGFHVYGQA